MRQTILNIVYLISKTGMFLFLPLLLVFTFNAHEFVNPEIQVKFLWACVFMTLFYMQCLILYLVRKSDYRQYIGLVVILIGSNVLTLKMFVNQVFATLSIQNEFFNNYNSNSIDVWSGWIFFAIVCLWAIAKTHKWRSDLIISQPYKETVVMFGAKVPSTWWQFWNAVIRGTAFTAHIAVINGKMGKFSKSKNQFVVMSNVSNEDVSGYMMREAPDINPMLFEAYLNKRNGERTDPVKNNCCEWNEYDPARYFK